MKTKYLVAVMCTMCFVSPGVVHAQALIDVPEGTVGATPLNAALEFIGRTYLDPAGLRGDLLPVAIRPSVPSAERELIDRAPIQVLLLDRLLVCQPVEDDLPPCASPADPLAVSVTSVQRPQPDEAVVELFRYYRGRLSDGRPGPTMGVAGFELHLRQKGELWVVMEAYTTGSGLFTRMILPWPPPPEDGLN